MSTNTDPRAEFRGLTDTDLNDELARLRSRQRHLRRTLESTTTRDSIAADVAKVADRARDDLRQIGASGLRSAAASRDGAPAWRDVERMIVAAALTSPWLSDALVDALGEHLPTESQIAPQRDELARIERRLAAIKAEQTAREDDATRDYMDRARSTRSERQQATAGTPAGS